MKKAHLHRLLASAVLVALATACSDPAADKPDAAVGEASKTAPAAVPAGAKIYEISPESKVGFVGSKVTGSHNGGFKKFRGQIALVDGNPVGSSVAMTIDTTSLWADNERLTTHLKSADFFDVESHPEASFTSTEIVPDPEGGFQITGNLSLHGVTKQIVFPALIDVLPSGVKAKTIFTIKRSDFGIVYPGKPNDLIREEVVIELELETVGLEKPPAIADEDEDGDGEEEETGKDEK